MLSIANEVDPLIFCWVHSYVFIQQRGHTVEKEFWEGVSPDMTEGMVAATTFNASHQNSWFAFMWRRPLNSVALTAPTQKGLRKVSDGTIT